MIAEPAIAKATSKGRGGWFGIFLPAPAITPLTDPGEIAAKYRIWQIRVLIFSLLGYATFYFVRLNLSVAMPFMGQQLGITKEQLGLFLTLHGVIYGISKFGNGFLADRANAAVFMSTALLASALLNVWFGVSSTVLMFGIIWMFNGWFQGMGFPPCARLMANWFPPKEFATKFSIWNTSHNIGSIGVVLLCGFLVSGIAFAANWRLCFFVPAVIAITVAVLIWFMMPDTPPSVGLPELEGTHVELPAEKSHENFKAFLWQQVFSNKFIWLLSAANFFVYAIRYAVFNWGPTMLLEAKHIKIMHAAGMISGFEAFGAMGALLGGWATDRFLGGRAGRACVVYMALAGVSLFLFWKIPAQSEWLTTGLLCATGFFVYGPQCLLAIACVKLATKRAAATAVGLTSIFGYASTTLSGWGMGKLVQTYGWNAGFGCLIFCAAAGTVLFILAWPAKPHGYKE
ncbi:MAG TPA: MFS transporter [Verrucomicrobiae bacterium]|jgi:OPA family glycerol-3-phosphate transporter-like MFS transporter/OPA family sugar phosphate sensor protein UhpC-like MFS transporter